MATSRLEIDLSAVERNLGTVRSVVGSPGSAERDRTLKGVSVCAVLKQDAYGLGAARLAKRLAGGGVEMFAVFTLDEARAVADAVGNVPILVLMPVMGIDRMDPIYRHLTSGRIHLTLHGEDQLRQLAETTTRIGATIPVHVQVDTGLSRGGVMPDAAHALVSKALGSGGAGGRIRLAGLMTHFASPCCDAEFTRGQAGLFRDFVENVKPVLKAAVATGASGVVPPSELMLHAANSCAMFRARNYHGTMVRVGQALFGYALEDVPAGEKFEFAGAAAKLEPCLRWTTTVSHVSHIPAGWPVGYGSTWRAPWRDAAGTRKTRIALVPVGYADGYPRALGGKGNGGPGWVAFTGRTWDKRSAGEPDESAPATGPGAALPTVYAPVVGRVSMDQITVDITDVPEAYLQHVGHAEHGPEVELIGRDRAAPNFISTLASGAGSITHELLTRIGPRVERVYRYPASAATRQQGSGVAARPMGETGAAGGAGVTALRSPQRAPGAGNRSLPGDAAGMAAFSG